MSKYLPYGGSEWLSQKEIKNLLVNTISEDSSDGYILETDLDILMNYMIFIMIIH